MTHDGVSGVADGASLGVGEGVLLAQWERLRADKYEMVGWLMVCERTRLEDGFVRSRLTTESSGGAARAATGGIQVDVLFYFFFGGGGRGIGERMWEAILIVLILSLSLHSTETRSETPTLDFAHAPSTIILYAAGFAAPADEERGLEIAVEGPEGS